MPAWNERVEFSCSTCGTCTTLRWDYLKKRRARGLPDTCAPCSNSIASKERWRTYTPAQRAHIQNQTREGVVAHHARLTPEERAERSRKAGAQNTSLSVQHQWETIKADPVKFAATRAQRGRTAKAVWAAYTPEQREARVKRMLGEGKVSRRGNAFLEQVRAQGVVIEAEVPVSGFMVDGLHRESNTILLFHGDFWHCHPEKHPDPEKFCGWLGRTVGEQWERDRRQLGVFYARGFQVVVVWESAWLNDPVAEVQRVFRTLAGGGYK